MKHLIVTIIKTGFLRNILLAAVTVSILFPLTERFIVYPQFIGLIIENTEEEAVRATRHLSHGVTIVADGITEASLSEELKRDAQRIMKAHELMKFKLFSKTGEIVYSTEEKDIGVINTKSYFFEIVAAGEIFTKLVRKNTQTLEDQVATQDVVETYVPVMRDGEFIGAFEIYYDITDRLKRLDSLLHYTTFILIGVAGSLLIVVLWTVKGAAEVTRKRDLIELELEAANKNLDERVTERTRDLQYEKDRADFANKSKSEFLANMSHELRTPLNSVIAYSEVLLNETFGTLGSAKNVEYVGDIHRSGKLLLEHIGDILDISKIEAGELDMDEKSVDVLHILPSLISMVLVRAEAKGVKVRLDVNTDQLVAFLDERQFKQIVLNLLSNAIKFTRSGGSVTLAIDVDPEKSFYLIVADTGIGIDEEDIQKVLEPFVQVANSQTRSHEGTGLGLAIVKSLVANHGGRLSIKSIKDVGTDVIVEFPIERVLQTSQPD